MGQSLYYAIGVRERTLRGPQRQYGLRELWLEPTLPLDFQKCVKNFLMILSFNWSFSYLESLTKMIFKKLTKAIKIESINLKAKIHYI